MSNARSPVFSHFSATISGLPSIRAYGVEKGFEDLFMLVIDTYSRPARTFYNFNRCMFTQVLVIMQMGLIFHRYTDGWPSGLTLLEPYSPQVLPGECHSTLMEHVCITNPCACSYLVYSVDGPTASITGFQLNMAVTLATALINWLEQLVCYITYCVLMTV